MGNLSGRPRLYDWPAMLSDLPKTYLEGRDYFCSSESFQKQAQIAIRQSGLVGASNIHTKLGPKSVQIFTKRSRSSPYPWDDWLDGEVHVLVRDRDFFCEHRNFIIQARRAARDRGLLVRTRTRGNAYYREVAIKAVPREGTS